MIDETTPIEVGLAMRCNNTAKMNLTENGDFITVVIDCPTCDFACGFSKHAQRTKTFKTCGLLFREVLEVELPKVGWARSVFINLGNEVHGHAEISLHSDGTLHLSIYQRDSERKANGDLDFKAYEFKLDHSRIVQVKANKV